MQEGKALVMECLFQEEFRMSNGTYTFLFQTLVNGVGGA